MCAAEAPVLGFSVAATRSNVRPRTRPASARDSLAVAAVTAAFPPPGRARQPRARRASDIVRATCRTTRPPNAPAAHGPVPRGGAGDGRIAMIRLGRAAPTAHLGRRKEGRLRVSRLAAWPHVVVGAVVAVEDLLWQQPIVQVVVALGRVPARGAARQSRCEVAPPGASSSAARAGAGLLCGCGSGLARRARQCAPLLLPERGGGADVVEKVVSEDAVRFAHCVLPARRTCALSEGAGDARRGMGLVGAPARLSLSECSSRERSSPSRGTLKL